MEQNENQDSIRERIRAYAFDLKLPLVRRDIDLLGKSKKENSMSE